MKVVLLGLFFLLAGVLVAELTLRLFFGFGNPPLYTADDDIGYLLAPNQRMRRFGNLIAINHYSMRAHAIEKSPAANTLRVFLIGDSIVNGNWWTDQSEILSARLENALSQKSEQSDAEVLNASANSWGPRNELAYLKRFGIFDSQIVMLVINTDDLFGTQPSPLQVGKDRSYPDKKPLLALLELTNRLKKQSPIPGLQEIQNEKGDRIGKIWISVVAALAAPVLHALHVLLHALFAVFWQTRVIGAQLFDVASVAWHTAVRSHDAIKRALLGAAAGQSDFHCHFVFPFFPVSWHPP